MARRGGAEDAEGTGRRGGEVARQLAARQAECARAVQRLCGEDARALQPAEVNSVLQGWLVDFDRGEALAGGEDGLNAMHLVGVGICEALDRHSLQVDFAGAERAARAACPRAFACPETIAAQDAAALAETARALQAAFGECYRLEEDGWDCAVDLTAVLTAVLLRLGWWVAREFRAEAGGGGSDARVTRATVTTMEPRGGDGGAGGEWLGVKGLVVVQILDAVHAMLSVHRLVLAAEMVELPAELPDFDQFHLEASSETWYTVGMASELSPGAVCQYKHEFGELFHSLSQVVYYHAPNYDRRRQLPLAALNARGAPAAHVLPLVSEIAPDVPVLFEHTGAGFRGATARHAFSWCLCRGIVVLVDRDMRSYCCRDLRGLLPLIDAAGD